MKFMSSNFLNMAFGRLIEPSKYLFRQPLLYINFKIMITHDFIKDFLVRIHPVYECLRKHIFKSIFKIFNRIVLRAQFQIVILIQCLLQLFKIQPVGISKIRIVFGV